MHAPKVFNSATAKTSPGSQIFNLAASPLFQKRRGQKEEGQARDVTLSFVCLSPFDFSRGPLELLIQFQDNLGPVVHFCQGDGHMAAVRVLFPEVDSGTRTDVGVWKLSLIIIHNFGEIVR